MPSSLIKVNIDIMVGGGWGTVEVVWFLLRKNQPLHHTIIIIIILTHTHIHTCMYLCIGDRHRHRGIKCVGDIMEPIIKTYTVREFLRTISASSMKSSVYNLLR